MLRLAFAALVSFALTAGLSEVCKRVATRLGIVAQPKADRWNRIAVPLLGGVAIAVSVLVVALFTVDDPRIWVLLSGAALLFLIGLVDDIHPLGPQTKFLAQIVIASAGLAFGLAIPLTGYAVVDVIVTLVWMVGITNAFNLLDNMDGLAAGIAAIAATVKLASLLMEGQMEAAMLAAILIGSMLGFLLHNFHPASIFMGDAGSLFLGFLIAGFSAIDGAPGSGGMVSVLLIPIMVTLVPIFDTGFVTLQRALAGRSISQGGRDHTSHRLVAAGLSERQAVLLLYLVAASSGLIALYTRGFGLAEGVVAIVLFCLGVIILGVSLGRIVVYPDEAAVPEGSRFFSLIADFTYKRQVATVAIDTLLVVVAYYAAYTLRFEQNWEAQQEKFLQSLPVVLVCKMLAFAWLRVYQGVWRYTSLQDLVRLVQAVTLGSVLSVMAILGIWRFAGFSRALFVLDWLLLLVFVAGTRLSLRTLSEIVRPQPTTGRPVLIYGAGDGGVMLLRELRNNRELDRTAIGFLDDDVSKQWTTVHGLQVLGGLDRLEELIARHDVQEIILSSQKISPVHQEHLTGVCQALGVKVTRSVLRLE